MCLLTTAYLKEYTNKNKTDCLSTKGKNI